MTQPITPAASNKYPPLFQSRVAAGFPSPADDYIDRTLDLNELLVQRPAATYFVRSQGDSMIDAGIFPNDILVVDRSIDPIHGDIVIACLHNELTVKRLDIKPRLQLTPMNKKYRPIVISEYDPLEIFGVVTSTIHTFHKR